MTLEKARKKLIEHDQGHLLKYYDTLSEERKNGLLDQIEKTDLSVISHISSFGKNDGRGEFSPLAALQRDEIVKHEQEFHDAGVNVIREGCISRPHCHSCTDILPHLAADCPAKYDILDMARQ